MAGIGPSCDPPRGSLPDVRCRRPTKPHYPNCEDQQLSALPRALPCKNTTTCDSSTTPVWMLVAVALVLFATSTTCYQCESFNVNSLAEIIPRMDLVERVSEPMLVSCHYNHTALGDQPVQFARLVDRKMTELPFTRYNESTITAVLHHDRSESYKIFCYAPTYRTKNLCHRQVNVGYPPQDLLDFRCVSPNWWVLNCSWTRPVNFVPTRYTFEYVVPHYKPLNEILVGSDQNSFELEVLTTIGSRDTVTIVVTGNNSLGVANFTHDVNVYNVVVPSAPLKLEAYNVTTHSARLGWHMHYRMDSLPGGLVHEVSWRLPPALNWTTKSVSVSVPNTTVPTHQYEELVELPHAHTLYEVKVRMHTATGALRDEFWSKPAVVTLTTASKLPEQLAATDVSSFEASNFLESRELFVYWRQLPLMEHNGDDLHYRVTARYEDTGGLVEQMPILSNLTYAKFTAMNSTSSYRFEITAVNAVGAALTSSEVIVPRKAHMPDTPDMFTVIKYKNPENEPSPIYRLLWKPPSNLGDSQQPIVSYTLFWCPVATYDIRCEEDLHWESTGDNLESLRLKKQNVVIGDYSLPVLFEKNMTGLPQNQKFGIAAVSAGGASSGIKWSSCSVPYDDSPPAPKKPTATVDNSRTVKVSWLFDCPDKSAVPLAVRIFYCEIDPGRARQQDFSDCTTPKSFVQDGLRGPSVISGLRPSSTVIFSLSVLSVVGASRHSVPVSVTMPEDVPGGPPISLRATHVGNTSVSLQWQPPSADLANGVLTEYEVSTQPQSAARLVSAEDAAKGDVTLRGLSPYTQYTVSVAACTRQGCAVRHPAVVVITTEPGVPATVNMFNLNSIDGKMTWEFDNDDCHSSSCTFDMNILYNGTVIPLHGLQQNSINLKDLNITCNQSKSLNVSLRAVGVAPDASPLYGPWNSKEGPCTVPVNVVLAWWIVLVVVLVCFLVALVLFVVTKCGFNVFRQITKPIKVPNLTTIDAKTAGLKHQSFNCHHPRHLAQPPLSHPHQGRGVLAPLPGPVLISTGIPSKHGGRGAPYGDDNNKKVPLLSQTSRSSETDLVEHDADRHGRNLSGDSSRSSGGCSSEADSAVASAADHHDTSSSGSAESDSRFLRQAPEHWPGSNLRQRSPGPYVMHGERPRTNIGEGYVAVRSNPSLIRDLNIPANSTRVTPTISNNNGQHQLSGNNLQRSTPNLPASATGSHPSLTSLRTPATSAGYFSTAESDELLDMRRSRSGGFNSIGGGGGGGGGYPMKGNMGGIGGNGVNNGTVVVAPPYSTVGSPFPLYSRHSCTPPSASKPSILGSFAVPSNVNELKYVAVGYSPPNNNNDQNDRRLGSTESAFSLKRRPPSMPSLVNLEDVSRKNSLVGDTLESAGAYCVVGNRNGNNAHQPLPSSQGYVTLSNQSRPPTSSSCSIDATINNMNTFGNSILVASPPSSAAMPSSRQVMPRTVSEAPSAYLPNGSFNEVPPTSTNSPINGEKPHPNTTATSNGAVAGGGYVTVGERGFPSSNPSLQDGFRPNPVHSDAAAGNYVTAASMPDRWAFNRSALPKQFDVADEVRYVASAPSENSRGRFHPQKISAQESNLSPHMTERPNTSDGLTNRPKRLSQSPSSSGWPMGGPSLSKQSSGYVSQEALSTDPLVMSPKRLFLDEDSNKSTKSISHEVSFV